MILRYQNFEKTRVRGWQENIIISTTIYEYLPLGPIGLKNQ